MAIIKEANIYNTDRENKQKQAHFQTKNIKEIYLVVRYIHYTKDASTIQYYNVQLNDMCNGSLIQSTPEVNQVTYESDATPCGLVPTGHVVQNTP